MIRLKKASGETIVMVQTGPDAGDAVDDLLSGADRPTVLLELPPSWHASRAAHPSQRSARN